jgi:hypothetical protein
VTQAPWIAALQRAPAEVSVGFAYVPPLLVVLILGLLGAMLLSKLLNRTGMSRFLWHPPLAFLALSLLMSSLVALFLVSP